MKTIAFFSNRQGVGTTSLVYHLAWMYADLGVNVVTADLDPQANLTSRFLDDRRLETLWAGRGRRRTLYGAIQPLLEGSGDIVGPSLERPTPELGLVAGDLALSTLEDELSGQWSASLRGEPRAFRVLSAFWRILGRAARETAAELVLLDLGPNLGALNRAALVTADDVVVPVAPDPLSLQALRSLGPALRRWRRQWSERRKRNPLELARPVGCMRPVGYVVMERAVRLDRPTRSYVEWMERIPVVYADSVLNASHPNREMDTDRHCLAALKHLRSLLPLAQEARKPLFALKPADGAIGGHAYAVADCHREFRRLAASVAERVGFRL